jgi:fructosamine-3-kinase
LCDNLEAFFEDVAGDIKPSVLHGDLWSGNIAGVEGKPAIFDPATYYGKPYPPNCCTTEWSVDTVAASEASQLCE